MPNKKTRYNMKKNNRTGGTVLACMRKHCAGIVKDVIDWNSQPGSTWVRTCRTFGGIRLVMLAVIFAAMFCFFTIIWSQPLRN